jgi:DNA replication ATP-dependent helicase Dna2
MNPSLADNLFARIATSATLQDAPSTVRELRNILEQLFRNLTAGHNRSFNGLFARTQFVFDTMEVPVGLKAEVNLFRRFANEVVHESKPISANELMLCLKTCTQAVAHFSGQAVPAAVAALYAPVANGQWAQRARVSRTMAEWLRVMVLGAGNMEVNAAGQQSFLFNARTEEGDACTISLRDYESHGLTYLRSILRPYQTLLIMQIEQVPGQDLFFRSVPQTKVVLEPDLLLDISELAECFQQRGAFPLLYLVKKLVPQDYKESAFQGNMVNAMLDAVIQDPDPALKDVFREAVAEQAMQAAAYGKESLNKIFANIKAVHWPHLTRFAAEVRPFKVRMEPTFLSPEYGLQGRLDVLVEYADQPLRKDIYELKSGKAPFGDDPWPNHLMQVVGYNLLLKSAFGPQRTGTSAILYSAAQENGVKHAVTSDKQVQQLLALRNEVVHYLLLLAEGDFSILGTITPLAAQQLPSFSQTDFSRFHLCYSHAEPAVKAYYQAHLSFILREWLNAKVGMYGSEMREDDADGFAGLWLYAEVEKKERFSIIPGLCCSSFRVEEGLVTFARKDAVYHNFRKGDTVILYPRHNGALNPTRHQLLKGRIDALSATEVLISLNNRQLDGAYFNGYEEWILEHDMYEANYWAAARMLLEWLDMHRKPKVNMLLGLVPPALPARVQLSLPNLNANQCELVEKAFSASDYYLIQGPPGTGKTSTIITRLVAELAEKKTGSLLVVAFTNRAVDEIEDKLTKEQISFIRLGARHSPSEQKLRQLCMDGQISEVSAFFNQHRVFLCTVATLGSRLELLRTLKTDIDTILVDEASQLTESQISGLLLQFKKFILVGDQNQLPPVVVQHPAFCTTDNTLLTELELHRLDRSLFERLMETAIENKWSHAHGLLKTHFRMHHDIAALVNPWYGHQLEEGLGRQSEPFEQIAFDGSNVWSGICGKGRLIYIPSPRATSNKYHEVEAQRVVALLRAIRARYGDKFDPEKTVGVVTPWRTQIAHIRQLISDDTTLSGVNIETVERFQGSENDIIIVSLSVYHSGQLTMVQSPGIFRWPDSTGITQTVSFDRKLLVTLSRARQQIILLADPLALKSNEYFYPILSQLRRVVPDELEEEVFV